MLPAVLYSCLALVLLGLGGCASIVHPRPRAPTSSPLAVVNPSTATPPTAEDVREVDLQRMALLWHDRTEKKGAASDYPIGPGDVLEISVPGMDEMKDVTSVRVSGDGMIDLPLVGRVQASGLDEEGLRAEIHRRLEADYMYNPPVNLFVREYRSRQVAVVGAVERPGLYNLASEADTILDMIAQAGGMKEGAAPRIQFIPAEPVASGQAKELASALPVQLASKDSVPFLLKKSDPIGIDLKSLTKNDNRLFLSLPVRPGDVIMVPGSGEVLVEGWVDKPGSYNITPGLTVVGAVAAAGGAMFAANTTSVKVIRMGEQGETDSFLINLEQVKRGEKPDVPVREGDVIEISSSALKAVPYGFYTLFTGMFRIGASVY